MGPAKSTSNTGDTKSQLMLSTKIDPDHGDDGQVSPLHLACISNHIDIVKLLILYGANITRQDVNGDQSLHWAATKGNIKVF